MVDVWLPYGKTEVCARIPTRNFLGSIEPRRKAIAPNAGAEIARALSNPIGTKPLAEIAKPGDKVALVVDDVTRTTPSHLMIPPVLNELNKAGIPDEDITLIFGCGAHRSVDAAEMESLVGAEALKRVKAISHDHHAEDQVYLGKTSFGTEVSVNKVFAKADVRVLTGDVSLHYYAGYGGGRKSVLPAVSSAKTTQHNHAMILDSKARTGILEGNPIHEDMVEAARLAEVDFILNIVTNGKRELVRAFAGDLEQAFNEGVKLVADMYRVPIDKRADIVVTSSGGHPLDVDLYQAYKAADNALEAAKRGGVVILVAECPEGHGNAVFHDWMRQFPDVKQMEKEIKKRFLLGGHKAYYLTKALERVKIILVSILPDYLAINVFKLKTAKVVNDALRDAFDLAGKNAKVLTMPYGNSTQPYLKPPESSQ